jgi:hypothetical protein
MHELLRNGRINQRNGIDVQITEVIQKKNLMLLCDYRSIPASSHPVEVLSESCFSGVWPIEETMFVLMINVMQWRRQNEKSRCID